MPSLSYSSPELHMRTDPDLVRASTVLSPKQLQSDENLHTKVTMDIKGDLNALTKDWTLDELKCKRRLVLISSTQHFNHLSLSFTPLMPQDYSIGMSVISCIYSETMDRHFVTSVDLISLLERLVKQKFPVQEKNRIRRNFQSLKPITVTRSSPKFQILFEQIMHYKSPRPRRVEKDVKVLYWSNVESALMKVLSKYTVDPNLICKTGTTTTATPHRSMSMISPISNVSDQSSFPMFSRASSFTNDQTTLYPVMVANNHGYSEAASGAEHTQISPSVDRSSRYTGAIPQANYIQPVVLYNNNVIPSNGNAVYSIDKGIQSQSAPNLHAAPQAQVVYFNHLSSVPMNLSQSMTPLHEDTGNRAPYQIMHGVPATVPYPNTWHGPGELYK